MISASHRARNVLFVSECTGQVLIGQSHYVYDSRKHLYRSAGSTFRGSQASHHYKQGLSLLLNRSFHLSKSIGWSTTGELPVVLELDFTYPWTEKKKQKIKTKLPLS